MTFALERVKVDSDGSSNSDQVSNMLLYGSIHVSPSVMYCQVSSLISVAAEPLSDWLDACLGSEIRDKSIFASLSRQFEEDFHSDMEALNV